MSLAVGDGVASTSSSSTGKMGLELEGDGERDQNHPHKIDGGRGGADLVESLTTGDSASSCSSDEEEEQDGGEHISDIQLGPPCTLKQHIEKDKDDESLRKWKEKLLGSLDLDNIAETVDPDVKILSLVILTPGRPDIILPVPDDGKPKGIWFAMKEGSPYNLKFSFRVGNNIVSGLKYTNTVWKAGVQVERRKEMLGTFSPQEEPYTHVMTEETTPSGFFARGSYTAKSKFVDDDNKCHLEINYTFEIRKDWIS